MSESKEQPALINEHVDLLSEIIRFAKEEKMNKFSECIEKEVKRCEKQEKRILKESRNEPFDDPQNALDKVKEYLESEQRKIIEIPSGTKWMVEDPDVGLGGDFDFFSSDEDLIENFKDSLNPDEDADEVLRMMDDEEADDTAKDRR